MSDVSGVTAVQPTEDTVVAKVKVGEAVGLAATVYLASTGVYMLSDADDPTKAVVDGITMTTGTTDGYCLIATSGTVVLVGATLGITETYIASDTPGGIKPIGDKALGDIVTYVGIGGSTTLLQLMLINTELMSSS